MLLLLSVGCCGKRVEVGLYCCRVCVQCVWEGGEWKLMQRGGEGGASGWVGRSLWKGGGGGRWW